MRYVVTGGAGFVGSHLVKLLVKNGHDVTVIDNLIKGKKENLSHVIEIIKFLNLDIRDYQELRKNLMNIDGVFHQAALTIVQDSFERPEEYHEVNVLGTENIFKLANENNFKVVYASSSSIYGNTTTIPIHENSEKNPINPYGVTKLDDEKLAKKYHNLGLSVIGLRYFNVYGPGEIFKQTTSSMILQLAFQAINIGKVRLFEFGDQNFDDILNTIGHPPFSHAFKCNVTLPGDTSRKDCGSGIAGSTPCVLVVKVSLLSPTPILKKQNQNNT